MAEKVRLVLTALTLALAGGTAAAVDVDAMLDKGEALVIYKEGERGTCVGSLASADTNGNAAKAQESARVLAEEQLAAYIKGRSISSSSEMRLRNEAGKASEAYLSSITTELSAKLRSVEIKQVGQDGDRTFVLVQVCQNNPSFDRDASQMLDDDTVQAVGFATIVDGTEKAYQRATDEALRNAVAQYNGVNTAAQTSLEDGERLRSKVASRTSGVIESFRVIKQDKVDDETVRVQIVARIGKKSQSKAEMHQAVREGLGRPAIYIDADNAEAARQFEALLRKNAFDITRRPDQARFVLKVQSRFEEFKSSLGGMPARRTTLSLSLKDRLSADDAIILTNDPMGTMEASDNPSLRERRSMQYAVADLERPLIEGLKNEFSDQFNNGAKILVTFDKFARLREVEAFVELLESLPQVKSAKMRPLQGGVAYVDVICTGDPHDLQMQVVKRAGSYRLNGLKLKNQKGNGLDFTF